MSVLRAARAVPLGMLGLGAAVPTVGLAASVADSADAPRIVERADIADLRSDIHREVDGLRRDMYLIASAAGLSGAGLGTVIERKRSKAKVAS